MSIVSMLLLSILDGAATTVVVIRTPEHLIVGADSLVVTWQPSSEHGAFYTCKLHQQGAVFFVIEGMGIAHSPSSFSAEKLARKAISDSHSIYQAASSFAQMSSRPYSRVMESLRDVDPLGWNLINQQHGTAISLIAIFFGVEHGRPQYAIAGLRVNNGPRLSVSADATACPGSACQEAQDGESAIVIGQSSAAYRYIGGEEQVSFTAFRKAHGDYAAVRQLIAIEETAVPAYVGGPIQIVTITTDRVTWNSVPGTCR